MRTRDIVASGGLAVVVAAACSLLGAVMSPRFAPVNIAMVYLLGVVLTALRASRGAALATSVLCVLAFDMLFVPPRGRLSVDDAQYVFTFAIMVTVALVISHLVETVKRRASEQAKLAVEAETERIRSTLLASVSHDLRTPLAVITGAASSLAEKSDSLDEDERRALAASVFEQAREVSERVDKLLQMTRLESGALAPQRDWASFDDIAAAVLRRLRTRLARHRMIVEIPPYIPLVRVDAALVEQALGNLLENAKHTPPDTIVRLRVQVQGGELVVSVEDYGGDIDDVDLARVFAKFHRGAMEGAVGGLGLGLAICHAIVRLHGGRAWAERIPAGGMAFRFSLPLEPVPAAPDEREAAAEAPR